VNAGRWALAVLSCAAAVRSAGAQIIPKLPSGRLTPVQPSQRDTLHDSLRVKWPTPDSVARSLLSKPGYSITRYKGDTAYFDATNRALDLLAAKNHRVAVDRDSQTVVSDSGIYYRAATRHVTTGGHYVLSNPSSGQADIVGGPGAVDYNFSERSIRVTRARLPVNNGAMWYMYVSAARVDLDSTGGKSPTIYARGSLTSCDDSVPDFHFEYNEAKRSGSSLVARPAVLYIKDIPVLWLPFIFSDTRPGRHSGILAPQFGVGDIIRNSPTYRRNVEHVGYYWALSDYMDFGTWLDWRSAAGATQGDPGWIKYNADWNYKWLDRFLAGRVGFAYTTQNDGLTNKAISWSHQQDFSHDSHFNSSLNYVSSTTLQRQNTFNPYTALATIS
jgi:lipopolysaccharide assembly outer membrane protein LptD (OstA)